MGVTTKSKNFNSKPHKISQSKKIKKKRKSIEETVKNQISKKKQKNKKKMLLTVSKKKKIKKKPPKKKIIKKVKTPTITKSSQSSKVKIVYSNKVIEYDPEFRGPSVSYKKKKVSVLKNANNIISNLLDGKPKKKKSKKTSKKVNVKKQIKKIIKKAKKVSKKVSKKKNTVAQRAKNKILKKKVKKVKALNSGGGGGAPLSAITSAIIKPKKPVKTVSSATKVVEKQPIYKFSFKIFKNFQNFDKIKKYIMKNKQKIIAFVIIVPILYHMITGKPLIDLLATSVKKNKEKETFATQLLNFLPGNKKKSK